MKDEIHKYNLLNTECGFKVFLSQNVCTLQVPCI